MLLLLLLPRLLRHHLPVPYKEPPGCRTAVADCSAHPASSAAAAAGFLQLLRLLCHRGQDCLLLLLLLLLVLTQAEAPAAQVVLAWAWVLPVCCGVLWCG
jgi:hypothetical protein